MAILGRLIGAISLLSAVPLGDCLRPGFHPRSLNATASDDVLEVVQAQVPPRTDLTAPACRQTIFEHSFGNSYGAPYVGLYSPPSCNFTTSVFNLSVVSQGRQYDRLALLFFGDLEIWRTSTAMPTENGIHWSYQKDMTVFDTLLRQEQKVIFDLSNVLDGTLYTGVFNVTLEALYFADDYGGGFQPAEQFYAISTLSSARNVSSVFTLPDDSGTVNVTLPRNVRTAVVSVMASGNSAEEFWYTNVPTEYADTFPDNAGWLYGYSPFREVQLLIDGRLAGVSWPFPILFTGGVDPGAWRPVVGIDAFDLPSFEIDVSPWLGLLCNGKQHSFQFRVVGWDVSAEDQIGTVGEDWYVTGFIAVWLDEATNHTLAGNVTVSAPAPSFQFDPVVGIEDTNGTATNTSLYFSLAAQRSFSVSSTRYTSNRTETLSWTQDLSFSNIQNMTDLAYNQSLSMVTSGRHRGSASQIVTEYQYPINLFSAYDVQASGATTNPGSVFCMVDRSLIFRGISTLPYLAGISAGVESFAMRQIVTSMYYWNATIVEGIESMDTSVGQAWLSYSGTPASESGVVAFSQYLQEMDDSLTGTSSASATADVPETVPLPYVEGEPVV